MKGLKGNKRRGTHSSTIELVAKIAKNLSRHPDFKGIRLGKITPGARTNGEKLIKILRHYSTNNSPLLLKIKDNGTLQECTVFTSNTDVLIKSLHLYAESCKANITVLHQKE